MYPDSIPLLPKRITLTSEGNCTLGGTDNRDNAAKLTWQVAVPSKIDRSTGYRRRRGPLDPWPIHTPQGSKSKLVMFGILLGPKFSCTLCGMPRTTVACWELRWVDRLSLFHLLQDALFLTSPTAASPRRMPSDLWFWSSEPHLDKYHSIVIAAGSSSLEGCLIFDIFWPLPLPDAWPYLEI